MAELDRLGVRYYIGGSVASSYHGAARSTLDADVTAELDLRHALSLMDSMKQSYYVSQVAVEEAVRLRSSFNLIHLATAFKIDVFVSKGREFDRQVQTRATAGTLDPTDPTGTPTRIASAEDIILLKLEWYRLGNEVSERQWNDATSVAKLQAHQLDRNYMRRAARTLGVDDLLERLFSTIVDQGS